MASRIVHLRIAERLLAAVPDLDPALFAIGNIAPESGVPDEKWERFDCFVVALETQQIYEAMQFAAPDSRNASYQKGMT